MIIGAVFIVIQLGLVFQGQFEKTKHFCWAPHNTMVAYSIDVTVDGQKLDIVQIRERYAIYYGADDKVSWEVHSIHNLFELIEIAEKRFYQDHPAEVVIQYRIEGEEERYWYYPKLSD